MAVQRAKGIRQMLDAVVTVTKVAKALAVNKDTVKASGTAGKSQAAMEAPITEHDELASRLAYWSNTDANSGEGVHTITVTDVIEGNGHIFIVWDYQIERLATFHGVPAEGKTVSTVASTFLEFDADGLIVQESTIVNDNPIYQQLGLPIVTPHYWDERFDFSTLTG